MAAVKRVLFFLITIAFCISSVCDAQEYYFRHYQVEDGLSHNTVFCALQNYKGFMWFGTKDGLNRYDGNHFKIFRHSANDSLSIGNNFVHCLFEDDARQLWIGTEKGLYTYLSATERFRHIIIEDSSNATVNGIDQDSKGTIWFIMGGQLYKHTRNAAYATRVKVNTNGKIAALCITAGDILWLTSYETLTRYDPASNATASFNVFNHSPAASSGWINKILPAGKDSFLLGTVHQGLKLFNAALGKYQDLLSYDEDKTPIYIRDCIPAGNEEYWIATESGIYIYNMRTGRHINLRKKYNNPYALSDNAVYCLYKDREGSIWAGTFFGGINYFSKQDNYFQKYFPDGTNTSISGNAVGEIKQDGLGNLWIGTEDGGLNRLNVQSHEIKTFYPDGTSGTISHYNIHGLAVDSNKIWIGTFEQGLDVMDIRTGKILRHYKRGANTFPSDFIVSLCKTSSGEILIGTALDLTSYNPQTKIFTRVKEVPGSNFVSDIIESKDSTVWVATVNNGLYYYNRNKSIYGSFRYNILDTTGISSDMINTLYEDSRDNLWIGTEGGGLCRLNKKTQTFSRYTTGNGLPSNYIFKILEDDIGKLWISTSRGLVCMNSATAAIQVYTASSGLLNNQFNYNSGFKDKNGTLYFGSVKGMISFNPAAFTVSSQPPAVYITGIQINGQEIEVRDRNNLLSESILQTKEITLSYLQSSFSLDFAALSFTAPEMIQYAYIMHGLDNEWTQIKSNRKAYFTNLTAGTYIFSVKASTGNSVWSDASARLVIKILPPPWKSAWAYTLYTLIAIGGCFYFIRSYHLHLQQKNQRKFELMEHEKEKELYKAKIDFFTNVAHEIRTPLTLIKAPLEKILHRTDSPPDVKKSLHIMERNTARLVNLTNQLLDFRQTEEKAYSLSFTICNVSEIIQETNNDFRLLAEQKHIAVTLDLPVQDVVASVDEDAVNKIITNLMSNAIKYAQHAVTIQLSSTEADFTIEITNDGYLIPADKKEKIFEPFYRLKETEKLKGTGIGLALSRSLAQLHKGSLRLENRNDEKVNTFVLTLPLQSSSLEI